MRRRYPGRPAVRQRIGGGGPWVNGSATAADFNGKTAPNFIPGTATSITMRFARGRLTGAAGGAVANLTLVPYRS